MSPTTWSERAESGEPAARFFLDLRGLVDERIVRRRGASSVFAGTHASTTSDSPARFRFRPCPPAPAPLMLISSSSPIALPAPPLPPSGIRPARSAPSRDRSRTCSRSGSRLFIVFRRFGSSLPLVCVPPWVPEVFRESTRGDVEREVRMDWLANFDELSIPSFEPPTHLNDFNKTLMTNPSPYAGGGRRGSTSFSRMHGALSFYDSKAISLRGRTQRAFAVGQAQTRPCRHPCLSFGGGEGRDHPMPRTQHFYLTGAITIRRRGAPSSQRYDVAKSKSVIDRVDINVFGRH